MKTVGLIPARGGSKSIPRKNIKQIAGKPLIAWTIEAALRSHELDAVVVSTEDDEIATIARKWGAEVPFRRPKELSLDETPCEDPVFHALEQLPDTNALILLQPTSPLRTTEDIDRCIALARSLGALSVASVSVPRTHPYWMYRIGATKRLRPLMDVPEAANRQDLPPVYAVNGAVYYVESEWFRSRRTFVAADTVGYVMPPERSVDVDTLLDWRLADLLLKELR